MITLHLIYSMPVTRNILICVYTSLCLQTQRKLLASFPGSSLVNLIWTLLSIVMQALLSTIIITIKIIRARERYCIYYLKNNRYTVKYRFLHTGRKICRFVYSMTSLVKGSKARQVTYFQPYVVPLVLI